nr:immunoglobulin light chain junction region [Macaca mulatta]
CLQGYRPPYGF